MRCASHGLVTFRVEQSSVGRGSAIATLVRISRYTLLAGASDHLEVLRQFSDGAHRLDANDSEVLLVGDVQSSVQRAHHHVVLVVHVWNAVYSHIYTLSIDYGNALLANAPRTTTDKLQRVLNAAARVITDTRKSTGV